MSKIAILRLGFFPERSNILNPVKTLQVFPWILEDMGVSDKVGNGVILSRLPMSFKSLPGVLEDMKVHNNIGNGVRGLGSIPKSFIKI